MNITYDEWREVFKPITEGVNKADTRESDRTGTAELVSALNNNPLSIWTLVEIDGDTDHIPDEFKDGGIVDWDRWQSSPDYEPEDSCRIVSGYHHVNRLEHYICEIPFPALATIEVID